MPKRSKPLNTKKFRHVTHGRLSTNCRTNTSHTVAARRTAQLQNSANFKIMPFGKTTIKTKKVSQNHAPKLAAVCGPDTPHTPRYATGPDAWRKKNMWYQDVTDRWLGQGPNMSAYMVGRINHDIGVLFKGLM